MWWSPWRASGGAKIPIPIQRTHREGWETIIRCQTNSNQRSRFKVHSSSEESLCLSWDCTSLPTALQILLWFRGACRGGPQAGLVVLCRRWARSVRLGLRKEWWGPRGCGTHGKRESSRSPNGGLPRIRISSISIQAYKKRGGWVVIRMPFPQLNGTLIASQP